MKKKQTIATSVLLIFGLFIIAGGQIVNYHFHLSDIVFGIFNGIGIGIILISLFYQKLKWG